MKTTASAPSTPPASPPDPAQLQRDLRDRVDGEVRFDAGSRGRLLHRRARTSARCRSASSCPARSRRPSRRSRSAASTALPVLSRGGGTSLAGQCTNAAVVIDWTKYCHRLVSVDAERADLRGRAGHRARRAQPAARAAPACGSARSRPRTMNCTLGGMIGNNSCGATAQRTGKVVDNIAAPRGAALRRHPVLVRADQRRGVRRDRAPRATGGREIYRRLRRLARRPRRPDPRALPATSRAGSPATTSTRCCPSTASTSPGCWSAASRTLVTVLRAELELVAGAAGAALVVLGYPTSPAPPTPCPRIVRAPADRAGGPRPPADPRRADQAHERRRPCSELPEGTGFLMVQFGGDDQRRGRPARRSAMLDALHEHRARARRRVLRRPRARGRAVAGPRGRPRRDRARARPAATPGRAGRTPPSRPTGSATTCATCSKLYDEFGYAATPGRACTATSARAACTPASRSTSTATEGVATYRRFMERAADLVVSLRRLAVRRARRRPVPRRAAAADVRRRARRRCSASSRRSSTRDNRMNPGKVVHPARLDEHLRLGGDWAPRRRTDLFFALPRRRRLVRAGRQPLRRASASAASTTTTAAP